MQSKFWTIMIDEKFLNSNFMRDNNENISEAVRFSDEESCREFFEGLRKDKPFKIVEVNCELRPI